MLRGSSLLRWLAIWLAGALAFHAAEPGSPPAHPLAWDAMTKTFDAKAGDESADFVFAVKNTSNRPVEVLELRPSCGCTVAELPKTPWILEPKEQGSFRATAEFKGKHGPFVKSIFVISSAGPQTLTLQVNIPETEETRRARNQMLALADRQAVFRGQCASCHVAPTVGKTGQELFQAACGICHSAAHRAGMVPDLTVARERRDEAYWRRWISEGRDRTLMPAFSHARGGPLSPEQIESLIVFALQHLPTQPAAQ